MTSARPIVAAAIVALLAYAYSASRIFTQSDLTSAYRERRVVVCGASTGIGVEIAYELAKFSAHLTIAARSEDKLAKVAETCRKLGASSVHVEAVDLSTKSNSKKLIESAVRGMGGIDVLILNHMTGYQLYGNWASRISNESHGEAKLMTDLELLDEVFATNILSYIYLTSFALPHLENSESGQIIAVGSIAGKLGMLRNAAYASTKHAIFGFFDSLRQDLMMTSSQSMQHVEVTTGVLAGFETDIVKNTVPDLVYCNSIHLSHPRIAAIDLLKGGARRWKTVYTPWPEAWIVCSLHAFMPRLVEWVMTYIFTSCDPER